MAHIQVYQGDLPGGLKLPAVIAVDAEMTGLDVIKDRLCLVQIGDGAGNAWLVQILPGKKYPNLKRVLTDKKTLKIFHFARLDVAKILKDLGVVCAPIYCTKIASKLSRPTAAKHSLKNVCHDLLGIELSKEQQLSDWSRPTLTPEQIKYAALDVAYLHPIKKKLDALLKKTKRDKLARACFDFMPTRAALDLLRFDAPDIFAHH